MLSSIHPLGERARNNQWITTVFAYTMAATATGAAVGSLLGLAGWVVVPGGFLAPWLVATVVGVAGALDLLKVPTLGVHRQVNERWIGRLRGWVYGAGFGAQLGSGVATYVVTWGVYAMFAIQFLAASPAWGAAAGGVFGLGRSVFLLAAGFVDRPSRLESFNRTLVSLARPVHQLTGVGLILVAGGVLL